MFEIWKLKKSVNMYVRLIANKPEKVKENYDMYFADAKILKELIDQFIELSLDEFRNWCDSYTEVWSIEETGILLKLRKKIILIIIMFQLNKLSKELTILRILKRNMNFICMRLNQWRNFTV